MNLRITALALASALAIPGFAFAETSVLFGNTLQIKSPEGRIATAHINADGTFSETRGETTIKGTWEMKDGKMCLTQTEPAGGRGVFCTPEVTHNVGETWTTPGPNGSPLTVTLIAGR